MDRFNGKQFNAHSKHKNLHKPKITSKKREEKMKDTISKISQININIQLKLIEGIKDCIEQYNLENLNSPFKSVSLPKTKNIDVLGREKMETYHVTNMQINTENSENRIHIYVSYNALKIALMYKVTNNNIDYISTLNTEDSSVLLSTVNRMFNKLVDNENLADVVDPLSNSDFEKLIEKNILSKPKHNDEIASDAISDFEELTSAYNTQDGIYTWNDIDDSFITKKRGPIVEKPISRFSKNEKSFIYNKLGTKFGDRDNNLDMTPIGGDVEQNYLQTKEQLD